MEEVFEPVIEPIIEPVIEKEYEPEPIMCPLLPPFTPKPLFIVNPLPEGFVYCPNGLLKSQRNLILNETDKYLVPDFPITPEQLIIIKDYRQALRDFTKNGYIMPDKPDFVITMN